MKADDYQPTRLEAAKRAATILVNNLAPNDHAGVILFESGATTVSYLTPFKAKTLDDIDAIRQRDGATAIGDGLVLGVDMANSIPNKKKLKIDPAMPGEIEPACDHWPGGGDFPGLISQ